MDYGSAAQAPRSPIQAPPTRPSLHPLIAELKQRIATINGRMECLLTRIRGAQPAEVGNPSKLEQEPSTLQHVEACHRELNYLEAQFEELGHVIN